MRPGLDRLLWRGGVGTGRPRFEGPADIARMRERVERFPLFDPDAYVEINPDLDGLEGLGHFAEYGVWESHRPFASPKSVAQVLGEVSQAPLPRPEPPSPSRLAEVLADPREIGVFAHSRSRWLTRRLAQDLAAGMHGIGVRAVLLDESADRAGPQARLFVAPHEFFTLEGGAEWASSERLAGSVMYSTVGPETEEFRAGLPFLLASAGVIDPHPQGCAIFRRAGRPALMHQPPAQAEPADAAPDHPLARALPRAVKAYDATEDHWSERPLDVVFMGSESPLRDEFFGVNAAFFAERPCVIRLLRMLGEPLQSGPELPALHAYLGRRAKVVLNLAREEIGFVDWRRMGQDGFAQRALVVSTPCLPHPLFHPGVHYLEDTPRRLPQLLDWVLRSPEGRLTAERVRQQGYATLMEQAPPRAMAASAAAFVLEHAR